jgi:hypothetical protein
MDHNSQQGVVMGRPILINDPPQESKRAGHDFSVGWGLLLSAGWLFVVVGLLNIVLIWIPIHLGSPEYEFASVAASFDSLPLPTMGLVFALAASRALARPTGAKIIVVLALAMAAVILVGAVLYWLNVPLALQALKNAPAPRLGIIKSAVKVSAQAVLYPIALIVFARMGTRG